MSKPLSIPYRQLSPEALTGIIEEFINREGTDYGDKIYSLEEKRNQLLLQLEREEAFIVFDPESESCNIISRAQLRRINSNS